MTTPRHLTYDSLEAWAEGEHLPKDWIKFPDTEKRKNWFSQLAELKQHLWNRHIASLTEAEQNEFQNRTHPSLSHKFRDRAQPFTVEFQNHLASLGYKSEVKIIFGQMDRLLLHATLDKTPPNRLRGVPWLFRGFELRYTFPDTVENNAK
jgi:hypothetical protein